MKEELPATSPYSPSDVTAAHSPEGPERKCARFPGPEGPRRSPRPHTEDRTEPAHTNVRAFACESPTQLRVAPLDFRQRTLRRTKVLRPTAVSHMRLTKRRVTPAPRAAPTRQTHTPPLHDRPRDRVHPCALDTPTPRCGECSTETVRSFGTCRAPREPDRGAARRVATATTRAVDRDDHTALLAKGLVTARPGVRAPRPRCDGSDGTMPVAAPGMHRTGADAGFSVRSRRPPGRPRATPTLTGCLIARRGDARSRQRRLAGTGWL
jgi:hypothetical protein